MGLLFSYVFIWYLLMQVICAKLMYVNGIRQKDLTPVNSLVVDELIKDLQLYANVANRQPADVSETRESVEAKSGQSSISEEKEEANSSVTLEQYDRERNCSKTKPLAAMAQNRSERGISTEPDMLGSLKSLLGLLMKNSSSRPTVFITNFAAIQNSEEDLN